MINLLKNIWKTISSFFSKDNKIVFSGKNSTIFIDSNNNNIQNGHIIDIDEKSETIEIKNV